MMDIDTIGAVVSIVGGLLLAAGRAHLVPWSLAFYGIGSVFWAIYAYNTAQMPLLWLNIFFIVVESVGLWLWIRRNMAAPKAHLTEDIQYSNRCPHCKKHTAPR